MAELKTKKTEESVTAFLTAVGDDQKQKDSEAIIEMMKTATGEEPKMWGTSIIGFGDYHYKYESGHEGDMCIVGFSPRKANLTLYLGGFAEHEELMQQLGKHKVGKGCLYIKKLDDVKPDILQQLIKDSYDKLKDKKE